MNIVIANQNFRILDSLNTEVIKTLTGEFSIEEVREQLVNMYYNKTIIDITAIKNYYDINSVIAFLRGFDPTKVVLLLNDSQVINNGSFLGKLVENGIYNFTRNAAGVTYLLENPNTYEDVAQYTKPEYGSNSIAVGWQGASTSDDEDEEETSSFVNPQSSYGYPKDNPEDAKVNRNQKVIGIQNLTEHAGSTSLAYMMIKQLKLNYQVKGIEMNKQDFIYFRDSDLAMCTAVDDFKMKLREFANAEVIIIDLNEFAGEDYCDEILYLVDPGTVKLNKLLKKDSNVIAKVKNGKVILNRSAIKQEDIPNFEYETKFKVFFNLPNINDRKDRVQPIDALLYNLGFTKQNPGNSGLFGNIFQKN